MTIPELYKIFKSCTGVATDSRKIRGGELFFALKGENFDGNRFALTALEAGVGYAVIDSNSETAGQMYEMNQETKSRLIPVEDTLKALQDLARWHRSMSFVGGKPITVIGLTGTNGKTTTKELVRAVLSVRYNVTATEGNLNNSIGVPLSLLKIDEKSEMAVIEMGASHPGDIKELVSVCLPNFGLITNVGKAHLLGFGSFEGVKKAKGELYDYLQRTADKAFINADNPDLCKMAEERPDLQLIPYGLDLQGASVLPVDESHPYLRIRLKDGQSTINTHLIGNYNADNVMAALAVGKYFGIGLTDAVKAVEDYIPGNNRSQLLRTENNTLIIDAYNANPTSMSAALENFGKINASCKSLMLGDMLELGDDSVAEHVKILDKVKGLNVDTAFFVGNEFGKAAGMLQGSMSGTADNGIKMKFFRTSEELADHIAANPVKNNTILIKGSRGTRMEMVIGKL